MTADTAYIVFAGGRLVLPAHTLYDRQMLMDHVLDYARRQPPLRVRVDHATWTVERPNAQAPVICRECARRVDRAVCRRSGTPHAVYCVPCALARPRLTTTLLAQLPAGCILYDVQARYAYGGEWVAWTRWPQATPSEIVEDIRLQRRFAPVLMWTCTEIRRPRSDDRQAQRSPTQPRGHSWVAAASAAPPFRAVRAR